MPQQKSGVVRCASELQDADKFKAMDESAVLLHTESIFLFSLVWSIGCSGGSNEGRAHFDAFLRAAVACKLPGTLCEPRLDCFQGHADYGSKLSASCDVGDVYCLAACGTCRSGQSHGVAETMEACCL